MNTYRVKYPVYIKLDNVHQFVFKLLFYCYYYLRFNYSFNNSTNTKIYTTNLNKLRGKDLITVKSFNMSITNKPKV